MPLFPVQPADTQTSPPQPPYTNNVGRIVNPLSTSHQSMQKVSIPSNSVNPFAGPTVVTNYVFNTKFRDNFFFSSPEQCTFTLPTRIKNVVSMSLSAVQIPNVMLAFSPVRGTNSMFVHEDDTGLEAMVVIPAGNYSATDYPAVLEAALNAQVLGASGSDPGRFRVSISPFTNQITIENTEHTFRMSILTPKVVECVSRPYQQNVNPDDPVSKNDLNVEASRFVSTMGYLIGYRKIEYAGAQSYTAESMYNGVYTDYLYFCVNEFTSSSQYVVNYGILPTGLINDNILAVIPLTSAPFVSTFDDNANYIYKTRNYMGPVDIQKISIKLLNPEGYLVKLHDFDFGFNLQLTTMYDQMQPYTASYSM